MTTPITVTCEWFARCENDAAGLVAHPVLLYVPTCHRCADKLDLDLLTAVFFADGHAELN